MASSSSSHIKTISSNVGAMINAQVATTSNTHIQNLIVGGSHKTVEIKEFNVPRLVQTYKGREKETEELASLFFEKGKKKIVVCGLPGFGKSELAKQFAKHCKNSGKVEKVIWVNAEKKEDLEQSFQKLSESVGVSNLSGNSLVQYIYEQSDHFVTHTCIFIFDNGLNRQCIADYEPPDSDNYFLLITSQEKDWGDDVTSFQLNPLTDNSALEVIESILTVNYKEEDHELYRQLADTVGRVPLGLQVVAAYVREGIKAEGEKFNLKEYVKEMKTSQEKYTNKIPCNVVNTYQQSLYGAIRISLNKLKSTENNTRDLALYMLFVCSYLNPEYIYFSDLLNISARLSDRIFPGFIGLLQFNRRKTTGNCEKSVRLALKLVDNYSFLTYNPDEIEIRMHQIIQEILLFHLKEEASITQTKCYKACLEFLLPDKLLHISEILIHADDNLQEFVWFYKEQKQFLERESYVEVRLCKEKKKTSSLITYKSGLKVFLETLINAKCTEAMKYVIGNLEGIMKSNLLNAIITNDELKWNEKSLMCIIEQFADFRENDLINILNLPNYEQNKTTTNDYKGQTLLHVVVGSFYTGLVPLLITKYQMEVNKQDLYGRAPLHVLFGKTVDCTTTHSIQRATGTAKQLIKCGASLDIKDSENRTPLEYAIYMQNYDLVEQFLIDIKDEQYFQNALNRIKDKTHLLHKVILHNKIDMMKLLLQYGTDVNKKLYKLNTPMHVAAKHWNLQALEILIQYNPDVNAINMDGNTPLFEFCRGARHRKHFNVDEADKILDILNFRENKSIRNNNGETVHHMVVQSYNTDLVQLFLTKYDMNINAQDERGRTPLHTLLYETSVHLKVKKSDDVLRFIKELPKYDARLDIKDNSEKTPIQVAQQQRLDKLLGW